MKRLLFAALILGSGAIRSDVVSAKEQTLTGPWTFMVEHIGLQLVLEQKDTTVTGTLDWPHGDPIKLTGGFADHTLTFSGDSGGENFTLHVEATGTLKEDDTLAGTLNAHFVDFNDAHQVIRTWDQEIPWTAKRGLDGVVHFPR